MRFLLLLWAVGIGSAVATGLVFARVWTRPGRLRGALATGSLSVFSVLLVALVFETVVYFTVVESDGFGLTLASQRWFARYWKPINSLGYRDVEHRDARGKQVLLVLGDSFAAGHGIADVGDRFGELLGKKLGSGWVVANVAHPGWNTNDELRALERYPLRPDVIVLGYFINDIEGTLVKAGRPVPDLVRPPPAVLRPLVARSYLVNLIYWRLYRSRFAAEMKEAYWRYLSEGYEDPEIWGRHEEELRAIARRAREVGARLLVVVFPHPADVAGTRRYTDPTVAFLRAEGIEVIDLAPLLAGRDPAELTVNPVDAHPSPALNAEVADLLYARLRAHPGRG